jgi:hypothetical protein
MQRTRRARAAWRASARVLSKWATREVAGMRVRRRRRLPLA